MNGGMHALSAGQCGRWNVFLHRQSRGTEMNITRHSNSPSLHHDDHLRRDDPMPLIEVVLIPGSTGANVQELHAQLTGLGAVIAPAEQSSKNYGPSTVAAVRAFRQQYGLPAGESVDKPTARLLHAASTFAGTGGRVALRAAVREAAAAADTSQPQELYWLARYATLSGDYQTAHDIAGRIPDHPDVKGVIDPILALPEQPTSPGAGQPP